MVPQFFLGNFYFPKVFENSSRKVGGCQFIYIPPFMLSGKASMWIYNIYKYNYTIA